MNNETEDDFTDTWWFLGICTIVAIILAICAF